MIVKSAPTARDKVAALISGGNWLKTVYPASDDPEDIEISEKIEDILYNMEYPLRKVRNDIYTALIYGYSISEIVYGKEEEDNFIKIKRIRPISIDTLQNCFKYDENGDLKEIIQTNSEGGDNIKIPPEKCLIYTYDEQFGDRKGHYILDAVYDNWFMKQKLLQWWNVYLQKHEGPTLAAFLENPSWKGEVQEALDDVHEGRA